MQTTVSSFWRNGENTWSEVPYVQVEQASGDVNIISPDTILLFSLCVCMLLTLLQAGKLSSLTRKIRQQQSSLAELKQELAALLLCERGMGDRIRQQQQQVLSVIHRQDNLEITDASPTSYKQAMVLLQKGASTDELIDACDLSRGELELLSRLNIVSQ